MMANTTCETYTVDHPCVEQSKLVFSCPADNVDFERQPDLISGTFRTKCKVCGLETTDFLDVDPRKRIVNMTFEFGPNALDGTVDEDGIEEYHIYFADTCGNLLPVDSDNKSATGEIRRIPVDRSLEAGCCTFGAYKVGPLLARMPGEEENLTVVVVPKITGIGLLSVGHVAGLVTDFHDREAEAFWGIARASGAVRSMDVGLMGAWLLLGAAVASLLIACE